MSTTFRAYAAQAQGAPLKPFEFDPGPLREEQVEINVDYCGLCHSDLSMRDNEFGMSAYPFVPGHEVAGTVGAVGSQVKNLKPGQRVGLGWFSQSCMACPQCLSGNHNLCQQSEQTIIHRHGGFADRVRCHWAWVVPLPDNVEAMKAGPLFCAGITVFNPIIQCGVRPTDRVGVVGIGGLGHLAVQFLNKWGCEVFAFSSSHGKRDEVKKLGAHHVVDSRDSKELAQLAGALDFIISTVNVSLEWPAIINSLAPKGRLHVVGVVPEPIPVSAFALLAGQKSVSGSPSGSPATIATMLQFCARHNVMPMTELFPMSKVNEAFDHLRSGKARYRIVLQNDFC